ncbi:4-hydroxybutyrate CoA-transferase [Anaerotignum faecicola]|nr:4-hydroxybutyrate CoA-transferase [Anaerotignum faecicola]
MSEFKKWDEIYKSKLVTAAEAVSHIKSGDRVVTGHAAAEPSCLINAMADNYENYQNIEINHVVSLGEGRYVKPEMKGHFHFNGLFLGASTRKAVEEGRADYTTSFFHEMPMLFREYLPVDVALVSVSKPDKHGFVSLGPSCDYTKGIVENAKIVIAQVNSNLPRTFGDCNIHVRDIDFFVECDEKLPVSLPGKIGDVEKKIGEYCASLIKDGDTLQLGIGSIPESVLTFLWDRKDLGLHTEMASDGIVDLIEAGVINNTRKNINKGVSVTTFAMGTEKIYDFIDDNPQFQFFPVDYINDPRVISQNDNMVSINSCIQVDLMGQVVSECIGLRQFSGVGGQVDFIRGAAMSKGGRAIIAMVSTAAGGKISRIVPFIDEGAAVTTSRNDVDYVVTEYGIAKLKGKTLRDRARALIEIAHPDFRDGLKEEYERRFSEKY